MDNSQINKTDIPVRIVIRVTKRENEYRERAKLILISEDGRECDLSYQDFYEHVCDLIVGEVNWDQNNTGK